VRRQPRAAFLYSVPIALLGGLMGLGGAEFRLPVLAGPLRYPARQAVPLNLAVSLVTLGAALVTRGRTLSFLPIAPLLPALVSLITGAMTAAFFGSALAHRLSNERLERTILVLLLCIGTALIVEGYLPQESPGLLPASLIWRVIAGALLGMAIGLVSSLLGVAGGELIIPTLVFAYGADIKTAGTASLLISLPTVLVGILRYRKQGAYRDPKDFRETVLPMGVGSVAGAILGGLMVGMVSPSLLKVGLGIVLIVSAARIFSGTRHGPQGDSSKTAR
jgi:uncharacterized membrane protein YfcA